MTAASRWKDVDDHGRSGSNRALAAKVRHRAFGRSGDDHVGAAEAQLSEQQLRAGIETLRRERPPLERQHSILDLCLSELAHDLDHCRLGRTLRGLYKAGFLSRLVPPVSNEQIEVDLDRDAGGPQLFEIGRLESGRHSGLL